jgi:hypothetical protein
MRTMRWGWALVLAGGLLLGACGGATDDAANTSAVSTTAPPGEPIVIRTKTIIAAEEGAEPIATGEVLEGSTLGGSPFCVAGTVLDSHAEGDPAVEPYGQIDRIITCSDGSVRVAFTPELTPPGQAQKGMWTMVNGTGAFEGLRGSGEMETLYDPGDASLGLETLTGTVTR